MPESFSSILEAVADEGRERMRPFPAEAVHALGRTRQRRRNGVVAATATFVSCVVAVGLVLGTGSSHGARPVTPPTSKPSVKHTAQAADGFLAPADVPNDAALDWQPQPVHTLPVNGANGPGFLGDVCGSKYGFMGSATHSRAAMARVVSYETATKSASADEGIYTYATEGAAADDLRDLTPDPAACGPTQPGYTFVRGSRSVQIDNGFGWIQYLNFNASGSPSQPTTVTEHVLVVQRGQQLAFFIYREPGGGPDYSTSEDSKALQKMADLLAGTPSTATPPTSPPSSLESPSSQSGPPESTSTASSQTSPPGDWLATAELPFAAKFAWARQGFQQPARDPVRIPLFGCQTSPESGVSAPIAVWDAGWQADPAANFAAKTAVESQFVFATEDQAAKAFAAARHAAAPTQCHIYPALNDTIDTTYGAVGAWPDAFSFNEKLVQVGLREDGQRSHLHEYLAFKGKVLVQLQIDTNSSVIDDTSGDAAVLAAMLNHIP